MYENVTAQEIINRCSTSDIGLSRGMGTYNGHRTAYLANQHTDCMPIHSVSTFVIHHQEGVQSGHNDRAEFVGVSTQKVTGRHPAVDQWEGADNGLTWNEVVGALKRIVERYGDLPVMILLKDHTFPVATVPYAPTVYNGDEPHDEHNLLSIDSPFMF